MSNDLISRQGMLDVVEDIAQTVRPEDTAAHRVIAQMITAIIKQSTAYDVDKVLGYFAENAQNIIDKDEVAHLHMIPLFIAERIMKREFEKGGAK